MLTLKQLTDQTAALGLEVKVKAGSRPSKKPYEMALRLHYSNGQLPYEEVAPMFCFPYWELSPKEQDQLWKDGNDWIAEQKWNGVRVILHFIKGQGVFAHSRQVSQVTFRRTDLSRHLAFRDYKPVFDAVVDTEATSTDFQTAVSLLHTDAETSRQQQQTTPLTFNVFDLIRWEGKDLRPWRLDARLGLMPDFRVAVETTGLSQHFNFPPVVFHNKERLYDHVIEGGGEGVVLKNLSSTYLEGQRSRLAWVKCKRAIEVAAYVSGFDRGTRGGLLENKVAVLIFSVCTEKGPKTIARVSALPWDFQKKVSNYDRTSDTVALAAEFYGKVATVTGAEISRRSGRLTNARILHWRPDLQQSQCSYSFADLERLRTGVSFSSPPRVIQTGSE